MRAGTRATDNPRSTHHHSRSCKGRISKGVDARSALTLDGLHIPWETLKELFRVNADDWEIDLADSREFFAKFGTRLPAELREEHQKLARRLEKSIPV